jgi:hypothetical protein
VSHEEITPRLVGHKEATGDTPRQIAVLRELTPSETAAIEKALGYLNYLGDGPYRRLTEAQDNLVTAIDECAAASRLRDKQRIRVTTQKIRDSFRDWLHDHRSFDDHFSAWLSRTVGDKSPQYVAFKQDTNDEYDSNFAYRLACTLRNQSSHVGEVVNSIHHTQDGAVEMVDGEPILGPTIYELHVELDGPKLANDFPDIKGSVKRDLRMCAKPLDAQAVVGAATLSCERIYSRLFLNLLPLIQEAATVCNDLHAETRREGWNEAMTGHLDVYALARTAVQGGAAALPMNLPFGAIPANTYDVLNQTYPDLRYLATRPPVSIKPADLYCTVCD